MGEKPEESKYPRRAHSITLDAGADTKEDLLYALRDIIHSIERGSMSGITGCSSFGYHYTYLTDPEMTHDRYMEEVEKVREV